MSLNIESAADPFWDHLSNGEFWIPECSDCGDAYFPPGPLCPNCGGQDLNWRQSETGSLYSFTRQHRTAPDFDAPIVMGVVKLDSGPRLLAPINAEYDDLTIGQKVRIVPHEYDQGYDRGKRSDRPFFIAIPGSEEEADE